MTIYGWDMSHYDAPSIGNAVAEGISFITHKAGGDANDTELASWWAGVKGLPSSVLLGAYWVLYPGTPEARADAFLARLDSQCPGWRNRDAFILQIDAEIWGGDQGTKPSLAEINAFAARLASKTGGKYQAVAYAPKWVYPNVASLKIPVWASSYVSGSGGFKALYPGDSSSRWAAYGKTPAILQYSSSATIGGQGTSDANAFKGTLAALKELVTPGGDMALTTTDADVLINRMTERMKGATDAYGIAMRAIAWQYTGGGLQGASSTLWALADTQAIKATVTALAGAVAAIHPDVDEAALATSIVAGLVDPLKAAILDGLPDDLEDTTKAAVTAAVEDAASRFRLSLAPAGE